MDDREVFVEVVEAGGFSAAARRLETTPAAVSRRIKALEARLSARLLQRTTRKVSLTTAGERYFGEVRRLMDAMNALEDSLAEHDGSLSGELRVVAPMSFGQLCLAPVMAKFAALHPGLRINLHLEDAVTDLIAEGIDVALRIAYHADSSLVARPLKPVPRHVCAAPDYLARCGVPETPAELITHACLHYNVISPREEWTFRFPEGERTVPIRGVFCSNNGEALATAAMAGLGLTLLPDFIVADALESGRLERVLVPYERAPLSLSVLYPSREFVPARTRAFVDFMSDHFGSPQASGPAHKAFIPAALAATATAV